MDLIQFNPNVIPRPIIKMGPRYLSAIIDSGTDVCVIDSRLAEEQAFKDSAFPIQGETTVTVGRQPYHLHSPYRVLIEFPERNTAYFETVYVFPLPMEGLDIVMSAGMPFSPAMSALVTGKAKLSIG